MDYIYIDIDIDIDMYTHTHKEILGVDNLPLCCTYERKSNIFKK